jgi:YbbR domain-containing protein
MRFSVPFTRNLSLKFIALALSCVLWFTAVGRERAEVGMNVPLELINIPKNMVITNPIPDGISVRIRGSVALTRQVANRSQRFSLDLAGAKAGPNHFSLLPESLGLPRGVEVIRLTPSTLTVDLEGLAVKKVNILPVIKGELVPEYMIEDIQLEPKSLLIRGPESLLNTVDILWTDPIDVTDMFESTTVAATPAMPDVTLSPAEPIHLKAHIKITEKIVTRIFSDIPVESINTDKEFVLEPAGVELTIRGPLAMITKITEAKGFSARVNLADLGPGTHQKPISVPLPPELRLLSVQPAIVNVTIMETPISEEPSSEKPSLPNASNDIPQEEIEPQTP